MNQASEFDDQESLNIPEKHLLALVSNSEQGGQVVEALCQSCFKSEDIGFLSGTESAAKKVKREVGVLVNDAGQCARTAPKETSI